MAVTELKEGQKEAYIRVLKKEEVEKSYKIRVPNPLHSAL